MTDTERPPYARQVLGIAGYVQDRESGGGLSRGERAELRRMRSDDVFPPEPFWTLVDRYDIPPYEEDFWRDVIPLMVDHPHDGGLRPGRALAQAGVSPARIERWLRLDPERARKEAARLLTQLDSGLDWPRFAGLLRFWTDRNRRAFARDYFLSPEHRERNRTHATQETS